MKRPRMQGFGLFVSGLFLALISMLMIPFNTQAIYSMIIGWLVCMVALLYHKVEL